MAVEDADLPVVPYDPNAPLEAAQPTHATKDLPDVVPFSPNWDPMTDAEKPPPPDYAAMGLKDSITNTVSNFPKGVYDAGHGLYDAVANPGDTAQGVSGLVRAPTSYISQGANSVIDAIGGPGSAQAADDWTRSHIGNFATDVLQNTVHYVPPNKMDAALAAPRALWAQKAAEYGTPSEWAQGDFSKLKKTVISSGGVTPLMDVASIADPALRVGAAAKGVDAASIINSSKFADALAASGVNLEPGKIPAQYHQDIANIVAQKGYSPATVREAIGSAASGGVTPPRPLTTQEGAVSDGARAVANQGAAQASQRLRALAGGDAPQFTDLGQPFQDALADIRARENAAYAAMRQHTDTFHPLTPDYVGAAMQDALRRVDPVYGPGGGAHLYDDHRPVQQAVVNAVNQLRNPPPGGLTGAVVDGVRKQLKSAPEGASPTTRTFLRTAVEGFDNGVRALASDPNGFTDAAGVNANGAQMAQDLARARALATQRFGSFGTDPSIPAAVRTAVRQFPDDAHGGGGALHAALLNQRTGPGLFDHLTNTTAAPEVADYVRRYHLNGNSATVDSLLNGPLGSRALDPDTLSHARFLNEGRKVFESQPPATAQPGWLSTAARGVARSAAPVIGGFLGHQFLGEGAPGAAAGAVLGGLAEQGGERLLHNRVLSGAPYANPGRHYAGVAARAGMAGAAAANDIDESAAAQRGLHARGGRVGHQHLVDRLFRHIERAKREEKAHTSSLLNQPDTAIAKALNVAQRAI